MPRLEVHDTGTGMDRKILDEYFLRVGSSYYNSEEFNRTRVKLRSKQLDFAPVSEFGIGFISCFMLGDRVEVETAKSGVSRQQDNYKYHLQIDGPSRLIRFQDKVNTGQPPFSGTRVVVHLSRGSRKDKTLPTSFKEIKEYIEAICLSLPYTLNLEWIKPDGERITSLVEPQPLTIELPPEINDITLRIPISDKELGLEGEIAIINTYELKRKTDGKVAIVEEQRWLDEYRTLWGFIDFRTPGRIPSSFLRGGFLINSMEFFEGYVLSVFDCSWNNTINKRYNPVKISRDSISDSHEYYERVAIDVFKAIFMNNSQFPGIMLGISFSLPFYRSLRHFGKLTEWFEKNYTALDIYYIMKETLDVSNKPQYKEITALLESCDGTSEIKIKELSGIIHELMRGILPKISRKRYVCTMFAGDSANIKECITSFTPGWKDILKNCRNYLSEPDDWSIYVDFNGESEFEECAILLSRRYGRYKGINTKFKDRFEKFIQIEKGDLFNALDKWVDYYMNKTVLFTNEHLEMIRWAKENIGDLKVFYFEDLGLKRIIKSIDELPDPEKLMGNAESK